MQASEKQYEYGLMVGNHFIYSYDEGKMITDDYEEATGWLIEFLTPEYSESSIGEIEAFESLPLSEIIKIGLERRPRVRIVRREVGKWNTVREP